MLFGPEQADGSQAVHRHLAHPPEDMLAAHPYPAPELVGRPLLLAERMPPAALKQDEVLAVLRDQVLVAGLREVGAVGEDSLVLLVDQLPEHLTVVHVGRSRRVAIDQLALRVHLGVVLIAVVRLIVFLRPARIAILLPPLRRIGFEAFGTLAMLDLLVLFAALTLAREQFKRTHGCFSAVPLDSVEPKN